MANVVKKSENVVVASGSSNVAISISGKSKINSVAAVAGRDAVVVSGRGNAVNYGTGGRAGAVSIVGDGDVYTTRTPSETPKKRKRVKIERPEGVKNKDGTVTYEVTVGDNVELHVPANCRVVVRGAVGVVHANDCVIECERAGVINASDRCQIKASRVNVMNGGSASVTVG